MRVRLTLAGGLVSFSDATDVAAPYPWLEEVGALRMAVTAGEPSGSGSGESPSLDVVIRNDRGQAAAIIGDARRAPAVVDNVDGSEFFPGLVSAIALGRTLVLTIEA